MGVGEWNPRTCLWRVSYGSRHSRWTRRCASLAGQCLRWDNGEMEYTIVFGCFPWFTSFKMDSTARVLGKLQVEAGFAV